MPNLAATFGAIALASAVAVHAAQTTRPVPVGVWGGDHASLDVRKDSAHIEFDCASGNIPKALMADAQGRFAADGTYTAESGGPARSGESPRAAPARYSGQLIDRTISLDVVLSGSQERIGQFVLTLGEEPRVRKCR